MKKNGSFTDSFRCAVDGLVDAWQNERNMKVHSCATVLVLVIALFFKLEKVEWLFVFSAIFLVLTMEMLNTSLERVVDLFTSEFHPLAMRAKNAAAGASLLASCYAVIVSLVIFVPRILQWFKNF